MKGLLLLGIAAGCLWYYKNKQNPFAAIEKPDNSIFPLKLGSSNVYVANIQKALINKGGEIAHLILSNGGANGLFDEVLASALTKAGYPTIINAVDYKRLVKDVSVIRNIAYVIDVAGAPLYSEVADTYIPEYGHGRDLITTLPTKTHLGTATGNFKQGMVEIATSINTRKVKFWVPTSKLAMVSPTEYNALKSSKILPKSDEAKINLLKS